MINVIIFGSPGSGKGTQSEKLVEYFDFEHVSTGELLRREIHADNSLGRTAKGFIDKGQLVPDELIIDIIDELLIDRSPCSGIIFDGFPRTIAQAEALDRLLARRNAKVDIVLNLNVPEEMLISRLLNRGKDSGRSDDNMKTISNRLKVYYEQTAPLADYYRKAGTLCDINGTGTVDGIADEIRKAVDTVRANYPECNKAPK